MFNIFRGPIELLMGVVFGGLVGVLCWFLPNRTEVNILTLYTVYIYKYSMDIEYIVIKLYSHVIAVDTQCFLFDLICFDLF